MCEVAKIDRINGSLGRRSLVFAADNRHHGTLETLQVVSRRIGGKMRIGNENDAVVALVLGNELEVVYLGL